MSTNEMREQGEEGGGNLHKLPVTFSTYRSFNGKALSIRDYPQTHTSHMLHTHTHTHYGSVCPPPEMDYRTGGGLQADRQEGRKRSR